MARRSDQNVIEVRNLSIRLASHSIVEDVSFSIAPGETLALVGESGCGKSVTALALMGLLPAGRDNRIAGQVIFEGRDLLSLDRRAMADVRGSRLAMVFQEPMTALNPVLRIGAQITETIIRHQALSPAAAKARAIEMLSLVKIPEPEVRMRHFPHELSGGTRQRVMIAMALANNPALLIADEPTTALDVTIQAQVLNLIRDLQATLGAAMLLITHDLGVVAEMADRVAVMYAGRMVEMAPAQSLFASPQHPYTLGLISAAPPPGAQTGPLATIPGSVPAPSRYSAACRFAPRCPLRQPACEMEAPHLILAAPDHLAACRRAPLEDDAGLRRPEFAAC